MEDTIRLFDTIIAPATTPGTGAISVLRVSGPACLQAADEVIALSGGRSLISSAPNSIYYGKVLGADGALLDEVLVSVFRAPHSYTGEDSVEISTHASAYIVSEIIRLFNAVGVRMAEPGEFTRRAFMNGKMDLSQAEAVADVISSSNSAAHRVAMNQLKGLYSNELDSLREALLQMASMLELELDFSEEDVEFAARDKLLELIDATKAHIDTLASSFRSGNMIKNGIPVSIVGAANAGKSTLLNALLGEDRAIVTDIPGTTRDTIEETLNIGGLLFRFIDTAGIRSSSDVIENLGIERTFKKISASEVVICLLDSTSSPSEITDSLQVLLRRINTRSQKCIFALSKADLLDDSTINKNVSITNKFVLGNNIEGVTLVISAKAGQGLDELKNALIEAEKDLIPNADSVFVTNERHFAALTEASASLRECRTSLCSGISSELVAEDLRRAIRSIGSILGRDLLDPDTILHSIFSRHCIGK